MKNRKLDTKTADRVSAEMNQLMDLSLKQLSEWKMSLKTWASQIKNGDGTQAAASGYVQEWIDQIKLDIVKTDSNQLQIVYDMPEQFVSFLTNPPDYLEIPAALLTALKDGYVMEEKPTAKKAGV